MDSPARAMTTQDRKVLAGAASAVALLTVGALIYGWVGLHSKTAVTFSDSMDYVAIADFYRAVFRGMTPPAETVFHYQMTRFPPLFPMLLGVFGGGSEHQHLASMISLAFSVTAPMMVWAWVHRETGSLAQATTIAAALLLYPAFFLLSLSPVSEPFAIFLSALALLLVSGRAPQSSAWAVAALVIGVALLARTALLPLAIALLIVAIAKRASWRRCGFFAALAFGPLIAWTVYRRSLGATGYSSFLTREALITELGGWPDALWVQPWRLLLAVDGNWGPSAGSLAWIITLIIGFLVLVGAVIRMRRWALDAWFLAGYVAMILIWPYPFELGRFIVVVYAVCLLAAMEGWRCVTARRWPNTINQGGWAPLVLLVMGASGPTLVGFAERASVPVDPSLLDDKRESFFFEADLDATAIEHAEVFLRTRLLARQIPDHVPAGECVYSNMPQFVALYGRRDSSSFPREIKSERSALDSLTECRYFFLADIDVATYGVPGMYPAEFIESWTDLMMVSNSEEGDTVAALLVASEEKKSAASARADAPPTTPSSGQSPL
jgi:hypothetical protein